MGAEQHYNKQNECLSIANMTAFNPVSPSIPSSIDVLIGSKQAHPHHKRHFGHHSHSTGQRIEKVISLSPFALIRSHQEQRDRDHGEELPSRSKLLSAIKHLPKCVHLIPSRIKRIRCPSPPMHQIKGHLQNEGVKQSKESSSNQSQSVLDTVKRARGGQ